MKTLNKLAILGLSGSIFLSSCESVRNANNTQKGVAIGAVSGAVIGGVLGNNIGKGGKGAMGAVLGGVVGGVAGGIIGNKMDKQAREIKTALPGAEVERVGEGIKVVLNENSINFNFNSANLTPTAKNNLDKVAKVFKHNPDTNINVYGHTDSKGADDYNRSLSVKRADAVVNYLKTQGLKSNRFTAIGMGESEPTASNDTESGRAKNRRVEFAITANEKMIEDAKKGK